MVKKYNNGTAQPNLSTTDLAKFLVPIATQSEQHRIVARVNELMTMCDSLQQQIQQAQTTQQTLASALVEQVLEGSPQTIVLTESPFILSGVEGWCHRTSILRQAQHSALSTNGGINLLAASLNEAPE